MHKPRLQTYYEDQVRPRLMKEFGFDNPFRVPRVEKVVLNVGFGEAPKNPKLLDSIVSELTLISGQKPVTTKARKAYQDFFALWKDADSDIPILIEAKKEYERLK